jgi:hypothetical protein
MLTVADPPAQGPLLAMLNMHFRLVPFTIVADLRAQDVRVVSDSAQAEGFDRLKIAEAEQQQQQQ